MSKETEYIVSVMRKAKEEIESLRQQLSKANEHIEYMLSRDKAWADIDSLKEQQLAAALAACKVKDSALERIVEMSNCQWSCDQAEAALAIQPDDSALQAFAEKVREKCAQVCDGLASTYLGRFAEDDSLYMAAKECAAAIRSLKELPK